VQVCALTAGARILANPAPTPLDLDTSGSRSSFGEGQLIGATLVTPRAGEIIGELVLAIKLATPLETLADVIHPFPAFNRVLGQVLEGLAAKVARQGDRHEQYTVER
jgi:pyridine nucleotide-disulfide oxidoreductase